MDCRICGDAVDDPFWDELCPECEHEVHHSTVRDHPGCTFCISEADDEFGYEDEAEATAWAEQGS